MTAPYKAEAAERYTCGRCTMSFRVRAGCVPNFRCPECGRKFKAAVEGPPDFTATIATSPYQVRVA